jgi:hypothetical protein
MGWHLEISIIITKGSIKNGQSKETGNNRVHKTKTRKTKIQHNMTSLCGNKHK